MLFAHRRRRRRDLYSAARPSRRNGLFTIMMRKSKLRRVAMARKVTRQSIIASN